MKVIIDAGHGPATKGKRTPEHLERLFGVGIVEYRMNRLLAAELDECLQQQGIATHHLPLYCDNHPKARAAEANRVATNGKHSRYLLLSNHCNAAPDGPRMTDPKGMEFVVHSKESPAYRLAVELTKDMEELGAKMRSVKCNRSLTLLSATTMPAIIIEWGFMTNAEDVAVLNDQYLRVALVRSFVLALKKYI